MPCFLGGVAVGIIGTLVLSAIATVVLSVRMFIRDTPTTHPPTSDLDFDLGKLD